jgi:hypothetical protein
MRRTATHVLALLAVCGLVLSACAAPAAAPTAPTGGGAAAEATTAPAQEAAGDSGATAAMTEVGPGEGELNIVAWAGYIERGETDAAIVQNPWVPMLLEQGFNKLYDFDEETKPYGRPDRVTVARKSFIERNPELVKRFWKAAIRGYHFMRIVPDNFAFQRYVEAKLRVDNPDESERMRDLTPMVMMEGHFFPLDGQLTEEGVWRILEEHLDAGVLSKSITRADVENLINQNLVQEAWAEISETDEVKRNLERLQPVIERVGY